MAAEANDSLWRPNALWQLGGARLMLGDLDGADAAFADAVTAPAPAGATKMVALACRASVAMARGDWAAADEFVDQARAGLETGYVSDILPSLAVHAVSARVAIKSGDLARGRADLVRSQLVRPTAGVTASWFSVHALLELGRAYLAISDSRGARSVLGEAEQILHRRPNLGAYATEAAAMRERLASASQALVGFSSLTNAELRLLPFLTTHLSFIEIGQRLGISRNTVKTEAMSVYGKLGASSRSEAVDRAVEIGLLEPFHGLRLATVTRGHVPD